MSFNLGTFLTSITPADLTALQSLTPSAISSLFGTSNAAAIGEYLAEVPAFYTAGEATSITSVRLQIIQLSQGASANVRSAIANVWSQAGIPNNLANLETAINTAKGALGLTN